MSRVSGTIVINGKTYDTASGTPITLKKSPKPVDGFMPLTSSSKVAAKPKTPHTVAHPSKAVHKTPARTHTLNRHYVKKPNLKAEQSVTTQHAKKSHHAAHHVDAARLSKALEVPQSSAVSRFTPATPSSSSSPQISSQAPPVEAMLPQSTADMRQATTLVARKEQLIAEGFEKITSHQATTKRKRRHGVTVSTTLASFLIVAGIITYFNIPNIAVKIAASKAGVTASMPNYTAGFHRSGPISYAPGQITLNFSTSVDNRSFAITQKKSLWDSQSLLSNYLNDKTSNYETFRDRGLTLYIYDGSNATWVDGGVWYTIEGNSGLSTDQLLKIAASM